MHSTVSVNGSIRLLTTFRLAPWPAIRAAVLSLPTVLLKFFAARFAIEMCLCARLLSLIVHAAQAARVHLSIAPVDCAYFTLIATVVRRFTESHHIFSACTTRANGVTIFCISAVVGIAVSLFTIFILSAFAVRNGTFRCTMGH